MISIIICSRGQIIHNGLVEKHINFLKIQLSK